MADTDYYSIPVAMIYLFNLLLGTGVLTMPAVFDQAGYISGVICLTLLCFISYIQTTFLIESMANANFVKKLQSKVISYRHFCHENFNNFFAGGHTEMSSLLENEQPPPNHENQEEEDIDEDDEEQAEEIEKGKSLGIRAAKAAAAAATSSLSLPSMKVDHHNNDEVYYSPLIESSSKMNSPSGDNGVGSISSIISDLDEDYDFDEDDDDYGELNDDDVENNERQKQQQQQRRRRRKNQEKNKFPRSSLRNSNLGIINVGFSGLHGEDNFPSNQIMATTTTTTTTPIENRNHNRNLLLKCLNNLKKKFNIKEKFELGNMTELFLNKYLSKFFFVSIISYLFGDLLIYNSMMSKSLRELSCTSRAYCNSSNIDIDGLGYPCWDAIPKLSRRNAYQLFLIGFIAILGPLTYAKIQKTKIIQIMTIILRWIAFLSMIGITIKIFVSNEAKGHPKAFNIINLPKLFGICVYSFMCHHSVPSIITPIKNKMKVYLGISIDYILVLLFYVIIALTANFAFENIQQVYTLNFQIDKCSDKNSTNPASIVGFDVFLPTFPIFTLFSSYTIVALTLINNMKVLVDFSNDMRYSSIIGYSMPLIAIIPPLMIALFTEDVSSIVQYVGSYSGTLIQYVYPTLLVYYSRRYVQKNCMMPYLKYQMEKKKISLRVEKNGSDSSSITTTSTATTTTTASSTTAIIINSHIKWLYLKLNPFASLFQNNFWIYFTAFWWILCLFLVTMDHLRDIFHIY